MPDRENEALERAAAEIDPKLSAEEKARLLNPELRRYADAEEAAEESDDMHSDASAPDHASEGVAEHEQEMQRRGFEKAGPPE
jgi:hypothetical protein